MDANGWSQTNGYGYASSSSMQNGTSYGVAGAAASPPQALTFEEVADAVNTAYKNVWGAITLWAHSQVSVSLVRNSVARMRAKVDAFHSACLAAGIDFSDVPVHTETIFALAEHCISQPPSPEIAEQYSTIMRERKTPYELRRLCNLKVDIYRSRIAALQARQ